MTWHGPTDPSAPSPRRYFISYATEDAHWAGEMTRILRAAGHEVFWDKDSLRAGTRWPDELLEAVRRADVVWLGWSRHAARSEWVRREYTEALLKGTGGIRIDYVDDDDHQTLPPDLQHIQAERSALARDMADALVREPLRDLPTGDVLPSSLLRCEHAVVPFTGREDELARIVSWCDSESTFAVRLYTGAGGRGKTRLAVEACLRARARGWDAGFLDRRGLAEALTTTPEALDSLLAARRAPRLLVLDYAETQRAHVESLLWRATRKKRGRPVRLVLIARSRGDWWTAIQRRDYHLGLVVGVGAEPIALDPLAMGQAEREQVYRAAAAAFAEKLKIEDAATAYAPDLAAPHFEQVLFLHLAALAHVLGETLTGRADLLDFVLDHEERYWKHRATDLGVDDVVQFSLGSVAATVALAGGYPSANTLADALAHHPDLEGESRRERVAVARVFADLYGRDDRIEPLTPDPIAERLIAVAITRHREWMNAWFEHSTDDEVKQGLVVLNRICSVHAEARRWITDILARDPHRLAPLAIDVAIQGGDPIGRVLAEYIAHNPNPLLAQEVESSIPSRTLALREFAVVAIEQALTVSEVENDRARLLNNLGLRLSDLGRREEALAAAQDSTNRYRSLAAADPESYRRDLAAGLNNLGLRLRDLGRRSEAIAATKEASEIYHILAEADHVDFLPDLAMSQMNLSVALSDLGEREEALTAAMDAVGHYRQLDEARSTAFLPELAMSLSNLGNRYSDLGRREDALAVAGEAARIYRRLCEAHPDAFMPELAMSLNNLGNRLFELGLHHNALEATEEAMAIRARLALARPDVFLSDFSSSQINLSRSLSQLGLNKEALDAAEEAVESTRRLEREHSGAFLPILVMSLNNLGLRLGELGRYDDALDVQQEAVEYLRRLVKDFPDVFLVKLADSLNNLAITLTALGRYVEAFSATAEATEYYRGLVEDRPNAFEPHLAASLSNLGSRLGNLGRHEEAISVSREAAWHFRRLAEAQPDAFLPNLARVLHNMSVLLGTVGQLKDALSAAEEAVAIRRQLADAYPDAHLPYLAMSLHAHSLLVGELGMHEESHAAAEESVTILREYLLRFPTRYASSMQESLSNYITRAHHLGREPDADLVGPIIEALERLDGESNDK